MGKLENENNTYINLIRDAAHPSQSELVQVDTKRNRKEYCRDASNSAFLAAVGVGGDV